MNANKIEARATLENIIRHDRSVALGGAYIIGEQGFAQLRAGEGPGLEYFSGKLAQEVPPVVVAASLSGHAPRSRCDGSRWVRGLSWDSEYPCGGCLKCRGDHARIGHAIGAFVWYAATLQTREQLAAGVSAFAALARIGEAVQAAMSPGAGVTSFGAFVVAAWNEVRKGRWYRVASKRGNAKQHTGRVGVVRWVGESTYGGYNDRRYGRVGGRTSERAGLEIANHEGLVYVSVNALEPVEEPEHARAARLAKEARDAERATFKPFDGCKGTIAYVIDGEHKGKRGVVFWVGTSRDGKPRVGLLPGVSVLPKGRAPDGAALWLDARDVSEDKPAPVGSEVSIDVECWVAGANAIIQWALDVAGVLCPPAITEAQRVAGFVAPAPQPKVKRRKRTTRASVAV